MEVNMQTTTRGAQIMVATKVDPGFALEFAQLAASRERSMAAELRLAMRAHMERFSQGEEEA
jgi:hypothetical protein